MNQQLRDRVILPFAIPVVGLIAIGVPVLAFSRILLAVGKDVAVMVAIVAAADILIVAAIMASRPPNAATFRLAAAMGAAIVLVGFVGVNAIGGGEQAHSEGGTPAHGEEAEKSGPTAELVAVNIEFDTDRVTLPANAAVSIELDNEDAATPHNFAMYTDDTLDQPVFVGDPFNGKAKRTYEFTSPGAGEYYFRCDVHPAMDGTVIVQ